MKQIPHTTEPTSLRCLYANVDGIVNKVDELQVYVDNFKPDIVCLTETKLSEQLNSEIFYVIEYTVYHRDRELQVAPGGGVAILVNKSFVSSNSSVNFLNDHTYKEAVWCEILLQSKRVLFGVIDRPPASTREVNNLLCDVVRLSGEYNNESQVCICGDFNFNEINWELNEVSDYGQVVDARNFLDSVNDCFLQQHVLYPTHNIDGDNPTRLDLIFSRSVHDVEKLELCAPLGKSHHVTLVFVYMMDVDIEPDVEAVAYKYNFHRGNYEAIRNKLSEIEWMELFRGRSVEEMNQILVSILAELIEDYVPKVQCVTKKRQSKWMTREVRKQISTKQKACKRLKS